MIVCAFCVHIQRYFDYHPRVVPDHRAQIKVSAKQGSYNGLIGDAYRQQHYSLLSNIWGLYLDIGNSTNHYFAHIL